MVVCILVNVVFSLGVLFVFLIIFRLLLRIFILFLRLVVKIVELNISDDIVRIVNRFLCIVYFFFIINDKCNILNNLSCR